MKGSLKTRDWFETKVLAVNLVLVLSAMVFWIAVILRLGLGTDYFFDVIITPVSNNFWGNILLNTAVILLPAIAVGINVWVYLNRKLKVARIYAAIDLIFVVGGVVTAMKRI